MAGFQKIYTSQNQYLEDVARSTGLFDDEYYGIAKETGKDAEYLQLIANMKDNVSSSFDRAFYDKLSGEERFNYLATEQYMDKSSDEYKKSQEYFNQRAKQIKNEEIYSGLNGFQKAAHSFAGFLGNAFLQVGGIVEGLVDSALMSMNFLAQSTGIPLIAGKAKELDEKTKELIAKDATGYNAAQAAMNDYINTYTFIDKNFVAQTVNDVAAGLVRMVPMFIPGAGQAGYVAYLASGAGNTAQGVIQENPDINYWQMFAYTAASTGLEALTEWASGKLFGDDLVSSIMKGEKYAPTGNIIKTLAKNSATEGLEEFVAELFGGILYNRMIDQTKNVSITDALYAALIGGLTGFLMTGGNVLSTKKLSLYEGKLVDPSTLTVEQRNAAKKIKLGDRWSLTTLINQVRQNQNATDNVTKLMAKYGVSLNDIKTTHNAEYQEALKQDVDTKTQQAKTILDLANVFRTIGEEQFQRATKFLEESLDEAQTLVDNYINHTPDTNKKASAAFSALYPNETFTPKAIPSNAEQQLAKSIREIVPNTAVVFGDFGSKEGLAKASINRGGNFIFVKNGLVEEMGYNKVLNDVIKYEIANDLIGQLPVKEADNIAKLALGEEVKYSKLTRDQKLSIAQMICFDQKFNQKTFFGDKEIHRKLYDYINNLTERTSKFGRKTESTKLKYNNLLKVRDRFIKSVADAVANQHDLTKVRERYNMSEEEFTKKVKDATRVSILNNTIRLTDLDFAEESISRIYAMKELLANITEDGDFDWSRLYDSTYYKPEFVAMVTQNESDFNLALRLYIAANYNMDLNGIQITTILDSIKNTMSEQDVRKAAETVLTKEFLDSTNDLSTIQTELANKLFYMVQLDVAKANLNADSIVVTDNQIQGTGEFRFFKGDVYERYSDGGENQNRSVSLDTNGQTQRMVSTNRRYEETTYGPLKIKEQNDDTLENYQQELTKVTQEMYGVNLHFYEGSAQNTEDPYADDLQGFYIRSTKDIFVQDDSTKSQKDILETIRHEIVHFLIFANDDAYQTLLTEINEINEKSKDKPFSRIKGNISRGYANMPDSVLNEEGVVEIIAQYADVDETAFREKASRSWYGRQNIESTMDVYAKINNAIDDFYKGVMQNKSNWLLTERSDDIIRTKLTPFNEQLPHDNNYRQLTQEQTDYFKDSIVRDENGNLLTMYHGSKSDKFYVFKPQDKITNGRTLGDGYYFTTTKDGAGYFGDKSIFEVYLDVKNPLDLRNNTLNAQHILDEYFPDKWVGMKQLGLEYIQGKLDSVYGTVALLEFIASHHGVEVSDIVKDMGYDGLVLYPEDGLLEDSSTQIVVYDSNQIKEVTNEKPTKSLDIRYSLKQQNKQETSIQQKINKAESPKQIADVITAIIEAAPLEVSETKGYGDEGTRLYKKTSDEMRRKYASLWTKITQENYDKVRNELVKSDYEYADEALLIFDRFTRAYAGNSTKFDEATKKKIMEVGSRKQTIAAISQGLQSAELANEHSFGETAAAFEKDGYKVTVSNDTVKEYVPEMANKKEFIKELDKEISNLEEQIKTAETDIDAAELNNQLDKAVEKRIVMSEGTNEEIMDWVIKNEDIVTKASKLQKEVFEQMVDKGELAQKEGKKAVTILVDEKTGLPKPFPKATQFIEKNVKRLKSFRMWAMLTSPVSWVRNWVGNAGMTALDGMTNSLEKFITSKQKVMSQQELANVEKQHQELSRKEKLTDTEKSKLAQLSNQIARNYDFKFVETKASKDLRKQIADDYKDVIQQILNGEDVKYESSAEKAAAITRAERKITRASQNANLGQKLWAACQSMTDWGLNTGWFGDNAVVVNSLVKNFANMVESNKTYLIKSLTTEYGKDGRGMSAERKALVEKALKTKDSMDIVNAMSKYDVTLFMDSCKQRTFEQYFKNSNWLSQWASNLSKKHPIAASLTSLVLPFPKVAANILSMAYKYSPLGFLSAARQWSVVKQMDAAGYEGVRDAFARAKAGRTTSQATVGSFMMLAGLILASLGFIDIDDDDYLGPSLKVGDWKVSLSNLAPSMTTFSVGSAMMWAWKNDQSATLKALDVLYDNTLLGNIENVFRYGDPSKYIENLSINYFSQYVPAMLKLFTKFTTNQEMIDKSGSYFAKLGKTFASGIPFIANTLPKKINPYTGETLTGTGTSNIFFNFIEALSPLDMRFDVKSATQKEAERLATESTGLSGTFKVNDKEYVVDKVTYSKYRANYIQDNFDKILSGKVKVTVEDENGKRITTTYNKLTDKQKKNVINRLYTEATSMTKIKWWTDQGNKYVVTNRDLYNEYRKMFKNIVYKSTWKTSKFVES